METTLNRCVRILVADDEELVLDFYRRLLCRSENNSPVNRELEELESTLFGEQQFHSIRPEVDLITCTQAQDAVEWVRQGEKEGTPFEIVFLDVRMPPGPDGIWAATEIRKLSPDVQIVIVTAYTDVDPAEITLRVPPADKLLFLHKPIHPQEVFQLITTLSVKRETEIQLRDALKQAQAANHAKSAFLSAVSHELRTPLTSIIGFAGILKRERFGPISLQQAEFIDIILRNSNALLDLVDTILQVAHSESGRTSLEPISFNLERELLTCLNETREKFRDKKLDIRGDVQTVGFFVGDPTKIRICINTLLDLAANQTPLNGKMGLNAIRHPDHELITIWDTGSGIPIAKLDMTDPSPKDNLEIPGALRLRLAQRYAHLHQGTLEIQNEPGIGSRYILTLPILQPDKKMVPIPPADSMNHSLLGKTILIIEDEADILTLVEKILDSNGCLVVKALSGLEGINKAIAVGPDVILLDIRLPDLDGYKVLQKLKDNPSTQNIPVIAITAYVADNDEEKCLRAGFQSYLSKPINEEILLEKIIQWGKKR